MTDIQLRWYTIPTEPEPEQVNMFVILHANESVNNISFGIPVRAKAQLDVKMLVGMNAGSFSLNYPAVCEYC